MILTVFDMEQFIFGGTNMRIFTCPFCGAVHVIRNTNNHIIFLCRTCDKICIVKHCDARPLTTTELKEIDDQTYNGIPGEMRAGIGIPIPMMDGKNANCRIGDMFLHVPDWLTARDLIARAYANEEDLETISLKDVLLVKIPEKNCQVDAHKLRDRLVGSGLGLSGWDIINKKFSFIEE